MLADADDGVNQDQRIQGTETMVEMAMKLSEGNPGAIAVIVQMLQRDWHGVPGFVMALNLDSLGIYGSKIWLLYKDCCGEDMGKVERVLRGWQTGHLTRGAILRTIEQGRPFVDLPTVDQMLAG